MGRVQFYVWLRRLLHTHTCWIIKGKKCDVLKGTACACVCVCHHSVEKWVEQNSSAINKMKQSLG